MTESEWQACRDPQAMLEWLHQSEKAGERNLRLFACACCRRVWQRLRDYRSRKAIEVSERYAERKATDGELLESHDGAETAADRVENAFHSGSVDAVTVNAAVAVSRGIAVSEAMNRVNPDDWRVILRGEDAVTAARAAARFAALASTDVDGLYSDASHDEACTFQATLIRCIFGNPFRPASIIGRAQRAWNEQLVVRLAQNIYNDRRLPDGVLDSDHLAVLADALEEAGVTDTLLLEHLRCGSHVLGCFAIDAILGWT